MWCALQRVVFGASVEAFRLVRRSVLSPCAVIRRGLWDVVVPVSEVSCQPNSTWSQSHREVTKEIHVDRKERVFQLVSKRDKQKTLLSCDATRRWVHAPVCDLDVIAYVDERVSYLGQVPGRSSSTNSPQFFFIWRYYGVIYGIHNFHLLLHCRSRPPNSSFVSEETSLVSEDTALVLEETALVSEDTALVSFEVDSRPQPVKSKLEDSDAALVSSTLVSDTPHLLGPALRRHRRLGSVPKGVV